MVLARIIFLIIGFHISSPFAQGYPCWFLNQGMVPCKGLVVGYANASYYPDSAASQAFDNACQNYTLQNTTIISGAESFWDVEGRVFWMGNTYSEKTDTSLTAWAALTLKPLAVYSRKEMVVVLVGPVACATMIPETLLAAVPLNSKPIWVETLPEEKTYIYAMGMSQQYYFEISSWLEAEAMARRNIAKSCLILVQSMQKYDGKLEQLHHEVVEGHLIGAQVMARWMDKSKNIFYVLIRMPI